MLVKINIATAAPYLDPTYTFNNFEDREKNLAFIRKNITGKVKPLQNLVGGQLFYFKEDKDSEGNSRDSYVIISGGLIVFYSAVVDSDYDHRFKTQVSIWKAKGFSSGLA